MYTVLLATFPFSIASESSQFVWQNYLLITLVFPSNIYYGKKTTECSGKIVLLTLSIVLHLNFYKC